MNRESLGDPSAIGDGVFKKRVVKRGRGKSGGYRVILASNLGNRWVFMFGFAKSERERHGKQETA